MPREPDVEISASVKAERLRFEETPKDGEVGFPGQTEGDAASEVERENLPEEVEPGVTYRDVRVRWRARARIRED
jgi:hypothetical protein